MNYQYIAYTEDKRLVKGRLSADSEQAAVGILSSGGYQVVNLKLVTPFFNFFNKERLLGPPKVKPKEVVMFFRQLALLVESGIDIITALELLQRQTTSSSLKKIIGQITSDIRNGSSLSVALSKHPRVFSQMYHRTIAAGEQGGNLEVVLRRMAEYIERAEVTKKKVKGALTYPIMVFVVAIVVVAVMVSYVLPTFGNLYSSMGAKLPGITTMLLDGANWFKHYGLYLIIVIAAAIGAGFAYIRTPPGRSRWDRLLLRLPVVGRITLLNELSRCCRTISLLITVGVPIPEVMTMAMQSSGNKAVAQALTEVQQELLRGEGLSGPMAKRSLFLPLMVEMVAVGEGTGNLSNTLTTVAESYEAESDDKITAGIALLQPALTIIIAAVVGIIALAMISAMYGIYGQLGA